MANYYRVTAGPVKVTLGNGDTHTFATNDQVDPTGEYYLPLAAIPNMLVDSGTPVPPPTFTPPPPSVKMVDVTSSATAPSSPTTDDLWFDTNTGQKVLKRWNGSAWESSGSAASSGLPATFVSKTANYTASAGEWVKGDSSAGAFAVTLPTAPATGSLVVVEKTEASTNAITVTPGGGGSIFSNGVSASSASIADATGVVLSHEGSNVWRVAATVGSDRGAPGVPGSAWSQGTTAPSNANGNNGDLYLNTATGDIYQKAAGAWGSPIMTLNLSGGSGVTAAYQYLVTPENISSTTYTDLTTVGPSVTVTVGSSGKVLLTITARMQPQSGSFTYTSFAASGANTIAPSNSAAVSVGLATGRFTATREILLTGLTAGSTTFTLKYLQTGGTASEVAERSITAKVI